MAVVGHKLHKSGASGDKTAAGASYNAEYHIQTDNPLDGPATIWAYVEAEIAEIGDAYAYGNDGDSNSFLRTIGIPKHVEGSAEWWTVTLSYEPTAASSESGGDRDKNGDKETDWELISPDVSVRVLYDKEPVEKATYRGGYLHAPALFTAGQEYVPQNSATEPYDPPLERDRPLRQITVKHRYNTWDDDTEQSYWNAVNDKDLEWRGWTNRTGTFEARTLKVTGISSDLVYNPDPAVDDWFWEVTVELLHDPKGWRQQVADRGLKRLARAGDDDGRGGIISSSDLPAGQMQMAAPVDFDGVANNGPILLDGKGQPLQPPTANAIFATWQKYQEKDIESLPIVAEILQVPA